MQLHSVLFAGRHVARFDRMARVLQLSAELNSPNTPLRIHRIEAPDADLYSSARPHCRPAWIENARKARHHWEILRGVQDGELVGMIDADTMIIRDITPIEQFDFDLAYTAREPGGMWKLNSGVYFVRMNPTVRAFCDGWARDTEGMLADQNLHDKWRSAMRYGGIHQAALGLWLSVDGIKTKALRCEEWNLVPNAIVRADNPRIVHIMSQVRDWCFGNGVPQHPGALEIVDLWKNYDDIAMSRVTEH